MGFIHRDFNDTMSSSMVFKLNKMKPPT